MHLHLSFWNSFEKGGHSNLFDYAYIYIVIVLYTLQILFALNMNFVIHVSLVAKETRKLYTSSI